MVAAVALNPVEKKNSPKTLGKLGSVQRTRVGTARAYKTKQEVKSLKRKGVNQMKKSVSLLSNLLLSSTLFWAVPAVADEMVSSVPTDITAYCHLKFPAMREDTLSWQQPVLDPLSGNIIDFYGPCDYDPTGVDEIRAQRRVILRGDFEDGD